MDFKFFARKKRLEDKIKELNQNLDSIELSGDLAEEMAILEGLFEKVDPMVLRRIRNQHNEKLEFGLVYCAGMIDNEYVGEAIIKPLTSSQGINYDKNLTDTILTQIVCNHNGMKAQKYSEIVEAATYGDVVVLIPGSKDALIYSTQGFPLRGTDEPENEKTLVGPKEGFGESLINNLAFLHRRLRTNDLKMQFRTLGKRTRTSICLCYLDSLVKPEILKELEERLAIIDIDGILDSNYIQEFIRDEGYSPFRTIGTSERPDVVTGKLLEGRIAIFVDGAPTVLTLPYLFMENFVNSEDYYLPFYYATFSRTLRICGFILAVTVPAFYLAVSAFNHEMLPTPLLISIARERQNIPFPMALEIFSMLLVFDLLREAGIRMPTVIGSAMSIVGGLVLGQAAVQARLVSSVLIIMVALTGITGLLVPKMNTSILVVRYSLLVAASIMGLPGLTLGIAFWWVHLLNLRSFGVTQIDININMNYQDQKDLLLRAPLWRMARRPRNIAKDSIRKGETRRQW
ncbi:MAG: spore germination protein [Clostridiales bacterium]